jgi:hypothetical protein
MAITNSISAAMPTVGIPTLVGTILASNQSVGNSLSGTTAQENSLTVGSEFPISRGWIRVKTYNFTGTSPTQKLQVDVTDGTNTYTVRPVGAAQGVTTQGANSGFDETFFFITELSVTQVNIITTLGGTTPTASLDFEIFAPN